MDDYRDTFLKETHFVIIRAGMLYSKDISSLKTLIMLINCKPESVLYRGNNVDDRC